MCPFVASVLQANTNPNIPIFPEGCCRIWLAVVILCFLTFFPCYIYILAVVGANNPH